MARRRQLGAPTHPSSTSRAASGGLVARVAQNAKSIGVAKSGDLDGTKQEIGAEEHRAAARSRGRLLLSVLATLLQDATPGKVGVMWTLMLGVGVALVTMFVGFLAWSFARSRRRTAALQGRRKGTHLDVDPWEESARRLRLPPEETGYRRHKPDGQPYEKPLDDRLDDDPGPR